jgi:ABC-2 type transport system permease protein/oleandomycin transport system permease protein
LPIARSAVLVGRTISDTARIAMQTILLVVLSVVLIGFRFEEGALRATAVVVVIVAFGMALTAFSGWVGLCVDDPETAQTSLMVPIMPLVFTSSAFAPVSRLPGWMQPFARWNPVTSAVDLCRSLSIAGLAVRAVRDLGRTDNNRLHRPRGATLPAGMTSPEVGGHLSSSARNLIVTAR